MKRAFLSVAATMFMAAAAMPGIAAATPAGFSQATIQSATDHSAAIQHVDYYYRNGHRFWRAPPPRHRVPVRRVVPVRRPEAPHYVPARP
jgi:hypothetical protein